MKLDKSIKILFKKYLQNIEHIKATQGTTERTYYDSLKDLFMGLIKAIERENDLNILVETKETAKDTPDLSLLDTITGVTIGFIEVKKPSIDISNLEKTEQIKKYEKINKNILITNIDSIKYIDDELLYFKKDQEKILELIEKFFYAQAPPINKLDKAVHYLSQYAKEMKELLTPLLKKVNNKPINPRFFNLFDSLFNKNLTLDYTKETFIFHYVEAIIFFSLFSKLENKEKEFSFTKEAQPLPLLKEWIDFFNHELSKNNPKLEDLKTKIEKLINQLDIKTIIKSLDKDKDFYLYFYEQFLDSYDKQLRKDYGVYYTDTSIAYYIANGIEYLLKEKLNLKQGLMHKDVHILDFALGTGTFLKETFKLTLNQKSPQDNIEDIIKRFYGFEVMVAPYVLSLFNIQELLKEFGYNGKEPLKIFLTNTLQKPTPMDSFGFEELQDNIKLSNKIKESKEILVIEGNPPYNANNKSNNFTEIKKLLDTYKPKGEINVKPISDDYVRFIRFAHNKIEEKGQGIIGIITNHTFIQGIGFRKMREELLKSFDEIYIYDLHGNSRKELEIGDQNVFNIQQGVSISFFVKTPNFKQGHLGKVYFNELKGSRNSKYTKLQKGFNINEFTPIDYTTLDEEITKTQWGKTLGNLYFFTPKDSDLIKTYGNFIGLTEIFKKYDSGIKTHNDNLAIQFSKGKLEEILKDLKTIPEKDFRLKYKWPINEDNKDKNYLVAKNSIKDISIKEINYRSFDKRFIAYTQKKGFIGRPRYQIMQHMLVENNIALVISRGYSKGNKFTYKFIVKGLSDLNMITPNNYLAPLYLKPKDGTLDFSGNTEQSKVNFTDGFKKFISQSKDYKTATPEQLFTYIYGILSTPLYQETFNSLLSIDFPRVYFTQNPDTFKAVVDLGQRLSRLHLMDETTIRELSKEKYKADTTNWIKQTAPILEEKTNKLKASYNSANQSLILSTTKSKKTWELTGITQEEYNYTIGAYKIIEKWVSGRNELIFDLEERTQLINLLVIIKESLIIQKELDETLESEI